jgi:BREX system ATP-binding protein BrxC/D
MAVGMETWLDLIDREYLRQFIGGGGSAVKFVEGEAEQLDEIQGRLVRLAERNGLAFCRIDAFSTRLHMIQDVFFAVSRSLDWPALAQVFVEGLAVKQGYKWPRPGGVVTLQEVAAHNEVDERLFRREFNRWLTEDVIRDRAMSQDFRIAMTRLCLTRLEPDDGEGGLTAAVLEWLRGELRRVGALRQTSITAKITRNNGRSMLRSLCRWLRLCGRNGLCLTLDIRQVLRSKPQSAEGVRYSAAAVIDAFEVLRQLIDDAEAFQGLMVVVLADEALTGLDPKRSLNAYDALKMRVWDDVRATERDNPLAPLVRLHPERRPPAEAA